MNTKKFFIVVIFLASLFIVQTTSIFAAGESEGEEVLTLKLAHAMPLDHPVAVAIDRLGKDIEAESQGTIKVTIYGNAQLGNERALVELAQKGGVDIVKLGASILENFEPVVGVLSMPYLYRDVDHYYSFIKGPVGKSFLEILEKDNLKGLTFYDAGSRSFYTKKPIKSPSDLKGVKIRTRQSKTEITMVESMGAAAAPIAFGELYSALQQGVVDGAENNVSSYVTTRHMEVAKYFVFDRHSMVPDILVMNKEKFDGLTEEQQQLLMRVVEKSLEYQIEIWNKAEKDNQKIAEDQGSVFSEVDSKAFMNAVAPMYDDLPADKLAWVEKIRSIK